MPEVEIKEVPAMTVMSLPFSGPYDQTQDKLATLMSWLLRVGHPYSDTPFGLYYDDPSKVAPDALRAEVCLPIEEECQPEDEIQKKNLPAVTVAAAVHQGPPSGIAQVYKEVFGWIAENGYRYVEGGPTREVFLRVYGEADDPEQFLTEVQVPVEKV